MKKIFAIDWIMLFTFVPSFVSGVGLHAAGHGAAHETWHLWAVAHVLASLPFLVAAAFHVATHRRWYEAVFRSGPGRRSRATAALSLAFVSVVLTGFVLLGVEGGGSSVGLWHYRMGIVVGVLSVGHLLKRISALRRGSAGR